MKKYDVIIVGAGPAGLSTAINLYDRGCKNILVIEKYKFPRYKCCAGYITNKTKKYYEKLGLDISKCHYSLIKDFNIMYNKDVVQRIDNKFLYTNKKIDRVELDNKFYKLAVSKGINVIQSCSIVKHNVDKNEIECSDGSKYKYKYLVFADGTMGFSSKYQDNKKRNIALQIIVKKDLGEKIDIHFGITKKGYGWVSSYDGITNIGLTDVYDEKKNYKEIMLKFLNDLDIEVDSNNLTGAFTPIGKRKAIINDNVYFVGDAVGACDPLTLSGLRYGLVTGEECAKSIVSGNNKTYIRYINKMHIKFKFMILMQKIFYLKSTMFLIFRIGCRYFGWLISYVFNNFFVNKK